MVTLWSSLIILGAIVFSIGAGMLFYATFCTLPIMVGRKEWRWVSWLVGAGAAVGVAVAWPAPVQHMDRAWLGGLVLTIAAVAPFYTFLRRGELGWIWRLYAIGWVLTLIGGCAMFAWISQTGVWQRLIG